MQNRRTWVSALGRAGRLVGHAADLPGIAHVRRLAHRAEFAQGRPVNSCSGIYPRFEDARRAIPPEQPEGYDHVEMAAYYRDLLEGPQVADYALMYWLRPALVGAKMLFDLGGHVGVSYYAFRRRLELREDLTWLVCDVPAVVREGEALARDRAVTSLRFTTQQKDADGADVLVAAGSLQYLPEGSLHSLIGGLGAPPRHVFVQRTPLHLSRSFVTIQATGHSFCPYTVAHRQTFIDGMHALGYELVDDWQLERSLEVPFEPWSAVESYSGLYFRLRG